MYNVDYIVIFSIEKRKRKENRLDQIFIGHNLGPLTQMDFRGRATDCP